MKDLINPRFYKDDQPRVIVETVGELKEWLSQLPDDLPVHQGFADSTKMTVYNVSDSPHLEFEEP